ncbi:MAG TPA: PIG-L family deacetylase [Planctomycetota bacterium]|jgi:LmbE family N-acetylglucosaminyl deacetylase
MGDAVAADTASSSQTNAAPWHNSKRILILIPHPDDETAGCCAAIGRARAAGVAVYGLVLTTGIPAPELFWFLSKRGHAARVERRRKECQASTAALGFTQLEFRELPTRRVRTTLEETCEVVLQKLALWQIDTLWVPAYEGGHADHDSTNALAAAIRECRPDLKIFEFAEYNNASGKTNSQTFPAPNGTEFILSLSPEEVEFKRDRLAAFSSAKIDLSYVDVRQECFRPLARYDYSRPPHEGTLFYERFHWVFFRHPAIDFTRSSEVSADLTRFLTRHSAHAPSKCS